MQNAEENKLKLKLKLKLCETLFLIGVSMFAYANPGDNQIFIIT